MIQWLIDLSVVDQVYIAPAVFELVCVCGGENNFIIFSCFIFGRRILKQVLAYNLYHGCEMPVPWL